MSELAGGLLQVITYENREGVERPGAIPVMLEFPVHRGLDPILVSSSKGVLWTSPRGGKVLAATRKIPNIPDYFLEVVRAAIVEGRRAGWDNAHPLTRDGVQAAIDHVRSYDLNDLEILGNPKTPWGDIHPEWAVGRGEIPLALMGLPLQPATWLPTDTLVVVPKDRQYVGFALLLQEHVASVVHNAPRGMGVATSWDGDPEPEDEILADGRP